jgi:hypothetical protein
MSTRHATSRSGREGDWYRIRIQGHLDQRWTSWFDGLALTYDREGTTILQGHVADQAALHGLLTKVRDMGLPLVSVTRERSSGDVAAMSDPQHTPPPQEPGT